MTRKILLIALPVLIQVLLAGSGVAHADEEIHFGIRPTTADANNPESFSFFSRSLTPGEVLEDAALVINSGEAAITLKLYASDGITAVNGGTTFTKQGIENHGVAGWITLQDSEITLQPGEERVAPFTIRVPSVVAPGEHIAGLVVESGISDAESVGGEAPAGEDTAGFGVQVVRRVGVAVLVDVPGSRVPGLDITNVGMREQNDNGAVFLLGVDNTGNISLKATGTLAVKDLDGVELASIPAELDTVLAGDDTFYYVKNALHLEDGDYLLCATLNYFAARGDETGSATCSRDFELTIKDGQPVSDDGPLPPAEPPGIVNIGGDDDGAGGIGAQGAVGLAVAVAVSLIAGILIHRRRRRNLVTDPDPDTEPPSDGTSSPAARPSPEADVSPTAEESPEAEVSAQSEVSFDPVVSSDSVVSSDDETPSPEAGAAGSDGNDLRREGVTVLPGVPGPSASGVEITDLGMREQNDDGAVFVFRVHNGQGSIPIAEGTLTIKDRAANTLASVPAVLGNVKARGDTVFYMNQPLYLQDGAYLLSASLQYREANGNAIHRVTCAHDFALEIKDGQPRIAKQATASAPPSARVAPAGAGAFFSPRR